MCARVCFERRLLLLQRFDVESAAADGTRACAPASLCAQRHHGLTRHKLLAATQGLYKEMGFTKPSRVQAQSLPMILTPPYRHLLAQAHNGSGKTTCFVLGMLSRVDPAVSKPQALCMCPTRELVVQNAQVLRKMATHTRITCATTATAGGGGGGSGGGGGGGGGRTASSSRMPPIVDQVVIGTPGTIINWIAKRVLALRCVPRASARLSGVGGVALGDSEGCIAKFPTGAEPMVMSTASIITIFRLTESPTPRGRMT